MLKSKNTMSLIIAIHRVKAVLTEEMIIYMDVQNAKITITL